MIEAHNLLDFVWQKMATAAVVSGNGQEEMSVPYCANVERVSRVLEYVLR